MASVKNDIVQWIERRAFPAITRWHRVQGVPRTHDFERALRAEVRDALWMLARQWQLGELEGDDAGSPVLAKLHTRVTELTGYRPGQRAEQPFDAGVPLEARVEQRPIPFAAGAQPLALDLRVMMGRRWTKLLGKKLLSGYGADFRRAFSIRVPDPASAADALVCAHREAWSLQLAYAERTIDGYELYRWLSARAAPRDYSTLPAPLAVSPAHFAALDELAASFTGWFERLIDQPRSVEENAWDPARLEYQFGCSAPVDGARK